MSEQCYPQPHSREPGCAKYGHQTAEQIADEAITRFRQLGGDDLAQDEAAEQIAATAPPADPAPDARDARIKLLEDTLELAANYHLMSSLTFEERYGQWWHDLSDDERGQYYRAVARGIDAALAAAPAKRPPGVLSSAPCEPHGVRLCAPCAGFKGGSPWGAPGEPAGEVKP